jgi:hypothetical protein
MTTGWSKSRERAKLSKILRTINRESLALTNANNFSYDSIHAFIGEVVQRLQEYNESVIVASDDAYLLTRIPQLLRKINKLQGVGVLYSSNEVSQLPFTRSKVPWVMVMNANALIRNMNTLPPYPKVFFVVTSKANDSPVKRGFESAQLRASFNIINRYYSQRMTYCSDLNVSADHGYHVLSTSVHFIG